jgi:hypothetical protein
MKRKPPYYNWSLTDWQKFHTDARPIVVDEIKCRCHNPKKGTYTVVICPAEFEFKFLGYTFVTHPNPDKKSYWESGVPAGDYHVSELNTGFRLSFGSTRDEARASARKILIVNARALRAKMNEASNIVGAHRWTIKHLKS